MLALFLAAASAQEFSWGASDYYMGWQVNITAINYIHETDILVHIIILATTTWAGRLIYLHIPANHYINETDILVHIIILATDTWDGLIVISLNTLASHSE